jgi:CheY-like chemotaxis protein
MKRLTNPVTILMADDDADDRDMTKEAFEQSRIANELRFVEDGVELMDYLHRSGEGGTVPDAPRPGLILLDLNMPKKDGREALREIKADPQLRTIPVVVLTTSKAEEDIFRSYDLGAASFISKPVTFSGLVEVIKTLGKYWLEIVELPAEPNAQDTRAPSAEDGGVSRDPDGNGIGHSVQPGGSP